MATCIPSLKHHPTRTNPPPQRAKSPLEVRRVCRQVGGRRGEGPLRHRGRPTAGPPREGHEAGRAAGSGFTLGLALRSPEQLTVGFSANEWPFGRVFVFVLMTKTACFLRDYVCFGCFEGKQQKATTKSILYELHILHRACRQDGASPTQKRATLFQWHVESILPFSFCQNGDVNAQGTRRSAFLECNRHRLPLSVRLGTRIHPAKRDRKERHP